MWIHLSWSQLGYNKNFGKHECLNRLFLWLSGAPRVVWASVSNADQLRPLCPTGQWKECEGWCAEQQFWTHFRMPSWLQGVLLGHWPLRPYTFGFEDGTFAKELNEKVVSCTCNGLMSRLRKLCWFNYLGCVVGTHTNTVHPCFSNETLGFNDIISYPDPPNYILF